jgi:hypothetical protein
MAVLNYYDVCTMTSQNYGAQTEKHLQEVSVNIRKLIIIQPINSVCVRKMIMIQPINSLRGGKLIMFQPINSVCV